MDGFNAEAARTPSLSLRRFGRQRVAAVGAVEEHSKTTLDGLALDADLKPPLPEP